MVIISVKWICSLPRLAQLIAILSFISTSHNYALIMVGMLTCIINATLQFYQLKQLNIRLLFNPNNCSSWPNVLLKLNGFVVNSPSKIFKNLSRSVHSSDNMKILRILLNTTFRPMTSTLLNVLSVSQQISGKIILIFSIISQSGSESGIFFIDILKLKFEPAKPNRYNRDQILLSNHWSLTNRDTKRCIINITHVLAWVKSASVPSFRKEQLSTLISH